MISNDHTSQPQTCTKGNNMNTDIKRIEELLEDMTRRGSTIDEAVFNLGIELGRILEKKKIQMHRPSLFVKAEQDRDAYKKKAKQIQRAEKVVEFLVKNAVAEQVEIFGPFCFDSDTNNCEKLDLSIVEKYGVQIVGTNQIEHGGSFEAEFILTGQVADTLNVFKIDSYARADVDNSSGDEHETIYNADDVDKIFGVKLRINGHHTNLNEVELAMLADGLEKMKLWLCLSLRKPR